MHVVDLARAEADHAGAHVDQIVGGDEPFFERRRGGDDLERRSRLVEILNAAVAAVAFGGRAIGVGIERRRVGEREDLAGGRVHDDDASAGRAVFLDAFLQLPLGDVLQVLIDRQLERRAGRGLALDVARQRLTAGIALNQHSAVAAAHLDVEGRLEPAEPGVVETDVTEHVRQQLALRIEAAALLEEPDALELERRARGAPRRAKPCGQPRRTVPCGEGSSRSPPSRRHRSDRARRRWPPPRRRDLRFRSGRR